MSQTLDSMSTLHFSW